MDADQVARIRLARLGLVGPAFAPQPGAAGSLEQVVRGLGAVQAQDYGPAGWSIAQRTTGPTQPAVDLALAQGRVLRTHVLRPTWHLVLPEDLRRLLQVTAPRILARSQPRWRQLGLDPDLVSRGRSVLSRALGDYAALQGIAPGSTLSVNISARNLLGRGLVNSVARLLAHHRVPAEQLTLEVAEPAPGISPGVTDTLTGLVRLGCRVSVSEFGTGRSSLMALSRYDGIRELKLDSGLVADILCDPAAERLVRAIIGTAHALEVRVVAEGVESREIVTRLRDLGCDALQGFWVRPPAGIAEITAWIASWPTQSEDRLAVLAPDRS